METVAPAASIHYSTSELIYNHDLAPFHNVALVTEVQLLGVQGIGDERKPWVGRIKQVIFAQQTHCSFNSILNEGALFRLLLHSVMHTLPQCLGNLKGNLILLSRLVRFSGDDKRRPSFIDEDGIHLIHNRELKGISLSQHKISRCWCHLIPQVVEAQLTVCHICAFTAVSLLLLLVGHATLHNANGNTQKPEGLPNPLSITPSEVVIHGHNVNAFAFQAIEVRWQDCYEGLPLASPHFSDVALMQSNASHKLHIKMAQPENPPAGLAYCRESLWQKIIQRLSLGTTFSQVLRHRLELLIALGLHLLLQCRDGINTRLQLLSRRFCRVLVERVELLDVAEKLPLC
mmetsp:Transcript_25747/g.60105  ORF Transcript_25747/g.60105 Transcript_25747/m.60105 type:complete len:345 (-) Transcript_25747:386-1420(-)